MFMVNPESAFNTWENGTENSEVVARISLMKVIREYGFLSQTRCLKTKLTQSFSTIKKRDYPILCTKWRRHMVPFRISLQKTEISKNMCSLNNAYTDCWTMCCVSTCEKNLNRFQKEGNMFSATQVHLESWCHYHIPISKQSSLTLKCKNLPHKMKTRLKTPPEKVSLTLYFDVSGLVLVEWMPKGTIRNATQFVFGR